MLKLQASKTRQDNDRICTTSTTLPFDAGGTDIKLQRDSQTSHASFCIFTASLSILLGSYHYLIIIVVKKRTNSTFMEEYRCLISFANNKVLLFS